MKYIRYATCQLLSDDDERSRSIFLTYSNGLFSLLADQKRCFNFHDAVFTLPFVWTTNQKFKKKLPILSDSTSEQLQKWHRVDFKYIFFHHCFPVVLFTFWFLGWGFGVVWFFLKCSYWISIMPTAFLVCSSKGSMGAETH